ncbi:outer membrane beta-barrel protein [Hymenobacter canadensis]|uniref:Outer membrane beta-barrel protein n=1 Tax=Hymenobacter canadensis TaxID=2999067 RepID=A0ABY7LQF2_9BACT|nr:outer membrane beta-barrel protein [Hymenobacter canadensis]WBA41677.1 outer membrane beta-barrel protein [Hymenobacter canadensis]
MRFFTLLTICFLLFNTAIQAQRKSFIPGYVVNERGDTLRGTIQSSRVISENGIRFRPAGSTEVTEYLPTQIRAFGLDDRRRFLVRKLVLPRKAYAQLPVRDTAATSVYLQQLTTGAANLYRLDFEGSTRFLIAMPTSGLVNLEAVNFRIVLQTLFSSCPAAVAQIPRTRLEENSLTQLVLSYSSCTPQPTTKDLRRESTPEEEYHTHFALQGGYVSSHLYYPKSRTLQASAMDQSGGWIAGMSLYLRNQGPLAFGIEAQYTERNGTGKEKYTVSSFYANSGEQFLLQRHIDVKTLLFPLVVHYTLGKTSLQPYVSAGPVVGFSFGNKIWYEDTYFLTPPPTFPAILPTELIKQVDLLGLDDKISFVAGGQVSAGIRPHVGKQAFILEACYGFGREISSISPGPLYFKNSMVRLGLEF